MSTDELGAFDGFDITIDNDVAELTLNRPEALNSFDATLHREFPRALLALRTRPDIRAVVLASTGKVFSAGGDFDFMLTQNTDYQQRIRAGEEARILFEALIDLPMPVIAAVHGHSIGLGTTIVLACDAVVACRAAKLSDPHVGIGLVAGDGGCVVWPQATGMLRARRYLITGQAIPAPEAHAMGLVTDLVDEPEDVLPAARELAATIAALPPVAVQGTKRALNQITKQRAGEVLALSLANEAHSIATEDLVEAIAAFREKRPPVYHRR
jgi:enoyl-CoA hydratase